MRVRVINLAKKIAISLKLQSKKNTIVGIIFFLILLKLDYIGAQII